MRRHHDLVLDAGGTCVMVSLNSVGPAGADRAPAATRSCRSTRHRNGWGMLVAAPDARAGRTPPGRSSGGWPASTTCTSTASRNKFCEPDDSVVASARRLPDAAVRDKPCIAMPVFSSGQWAEAGAGHLRRARRADLIYVCGGGIMAHPEGAGGRRAQRCARRGRRRCAGDSLAAAHARTPRARRGELPPGDRRAFGP